MFFSEMQMLIRNMLRTNANLLRKNSGKENDRPDKEKQGYERR